MPQFTMRIFKFILAAIAGVAIIVGCSTNSVSTAYKTSSAIDASVTTGWSLWQAYLQANPTVSTNTIAQVSAAFQKIQQAELVAIDLEAVAASSTNSAAITSALTTAIANESSELVDLENLLATFNIKL